MVTAPVQKDLINQAGFTFSGHTEFLADLCGEANPVMLLTAGQLRVALVTTHMPLRQVADAISAELIMQILEILDQDLEYKFGLHHPHIKVCGLNPHAGESGVGIGATAFDIWTRQLRDEAYVVFPDVQT